VAQGGDDSDTPGQFVGRVSWNVYDSATGWFLLIPQNSKVIGTYDNVVTNGQTRIPTVITRIIFPDSSSIPIGAMPAADQGGFAGLHDQVDTHLWEKFGNALILAIGSAGIQLSQGTGQNPNGYNAQQIGAAAIGQQFGELGQEYARSGLSIPPVNYSQRLQLCRPGYEGHGSPALCRSSECWRATHPSRTCVAVAPSDKCLRAGRLSPLWVVLRLSVLGQRGQKTGRPSGTGRRRIGGFRAGGMGKVLFADPGEVPGFRSALAAPDLCYR
jgi:Bacterial conjugation TrbI-like protein